MVGHGMQFYILYLSLSCANYQHRAQTHRGGDRQDNNRVYSFISRFAVDFCRSCGACWHSAEEVSWKGLSDMHGRSMSPEIANFTHGTCVNPVLIAT